MFAYNVAHFVKTKKKEGQEERREEREERNQRKKKEKRVNRKTPFTIRHLVTSEWYYFKCLRVWGDRMQHLTLCNVAEVNIWAAEER